MNLPKTIKIERNGYIFQTCFEYPFYRFKGASKPKTPPVAAPTPTAREIDEDVKLKEAARRRQRIATAGRGGTILTQNLGQSSQSASLLGRSTA